MDLVFGELFRVSANPTIPEEERERKAQERAEAERKREEEHGSAAREWPILSLAYPIPDRKDMKNWKDALGL